MQIGMVTSDRPGEIDRLISATANRLLAEGVALAGVAKVQNMATLHDPNCDMDIKVLPDGPEIRITQSLGKGAKGCRLNPEGIARAVAAVSSGGIENAALFVLNKFGPEEAEGHGFCESIGTAVAHDIPVLVGVSRGNRVAFERFVDGMGKALPPEPDTIYGWCKAAIIAKTA